MRRGLVGLAFGLVVLGGALALLIPPPCAHVGWQMAQAKEMEAKVMGAREMEVGVEILSVMSVNGMDTALSRSCLLLAA